MSSRVLACPRESSRVVRTPWRCGWPCVCSPARLPCRSRSSASCGRTSAVPCTVRRTRWVGLSLRTVWVGRLVSSSSGGIAVQRFGMRRSVIPTNRGFARSRPGGRSGRGLERLGDAPQRALQRRPRERSARLAVQSVRCAARQCRPRRACCGDLWRRGHTRTGGVDAVGWLANAFVIATAIASAALVAVITEGSAWEEASAPSPAPPPPAASTLRTATSVQRIGLVVSLVLFFVYVAIEVGTGSWLATYLEDHGGRPRGARREPL